MSSMSWSVRFVAKPAMMGFCRLPSRKAYSVFSSSHSEGKPLGGENRVHDLTLAGQMALLEMECGCELGTASGFRAMYGGQYNFFGQSVNCCAT